MNIDVELLERIAKERRFKDAALDIAKRLFVHGETPKRVAHEFGYSTQRIYAIRKEVLDAAQSLSLPPGWEEMRISGPSDVIARIREQFMAEMAKLDPH